MTLLAAASGLLLGAAFLPRVPGIVAWFAFVPLLHALESHLERGGRARGDFALGWVAGVAFFLVGTHWIALMNDVALTIGWLKYLGWVLGSLYLALFWGLAAWLAGGLARRSGLPARWTFLPAMLLAEELRGSGDLGFPWFQPGYSQSGLAPVLQLAALGGVTLVTLWLLTVNAGLLGAWRSRTRSAVLLLAACLVLPLGWGAWRLQGGPGPEGPLVALVQGNIPGERKWSGRHGQEILDAFVSLSDSAARASDGPLDLVVWPETATGSFLRRVPDQSLQVSALSARIGAPVFMGFAHYDWGADGKPRVWNAASAWLPEGSLAEVYAKRHLVPFGERVPFQALFPMLGSWDLGQAEWLPGERSVLFETRSGVRFAPLICFESIFPDLARGDVRAGARCLVNITNDEWFGDGAALRQHAAMAPFRAVEHGVPLLRCANTGLTQVIDRHGRVTAALPVFQPGVLLARLPAAGPATPFTRLGDWCGALALVAALVLAWAPWARRRAR